jgi:hypothetical protein
MRLEDGRAVEPASTGFAGGCFDRADAAEGSEGRCPKAPAEIVETVRQLLIAADAAAKAKSG